MNRLQVSGIIALVAVLWGRPSAVPENDRAGRTIALLEYRFELVRSPALAVRIHVTLDGMADGSTTLKVSDHWGGVNAGGEDITDVRATLASGDALQFLRPEPHRIEVHHPPGERITVSYAFAENDHQTQGDRADYRRPIVNDSLFRTVGRLGLLRPTGIDGDSLCTVRFQWEGFEAAGWQVVSSWGAGEDTREVAATTEDVAGALFVAGDVALLTRNIRGHPLTVTVAGDRWAFTPDEFADLCTRLVETERAFFDDFERDFYWVSLVPTGPPMEHGASIGGSGLKNCFSMSVTPNAGFNEGDLGGQELVRILAHEMFHEWNGHVMLRQEPEELLYWFSEGFTDYYARCFLYRDGFMDIGDYAASLSHSLEQYATNPLRDEPNERIMEAFWQSSDAHNLPYRRGDVVAMVLDASVRRRSGGRQSLDDVMRELLRAAREEGRSLSIDYLFRTFDEFADRKTVASLREIVENGGMPALEDDTFGPCFAITGVDVHVFDVGFDLQPSIRDRVVTGLRDDTEAYRAGLRNGMPLMRWSVYGGDPNKEAVFRVEVDGETKDIAYLPKGHAVTAHRVDPVEGPNDNNCD